MRQVRVGLGVLLGAVIARAQPPSQPPTPPPGLIERFEGSQLFVQLTTGLTTFAPDLQQTRATTVDTSWYLMPRFSLGTAWQLRARTVLTLELTDTVATQTQTRREPRFQDLTLQLLYRAIPEFLHTKLLVGPQLGLPLSTESRARTMVLAPAVVAQLSTIFDKVLGGEAMIALVGTYVHPFYRSITATLDRPAPYTPRCWGGDSTCASQFTGQANASDLLTWSVLADATWGRWSPGAYFLVMHQFPYQFASLEGVSGGQGTAVRLNTFFNVWVDADVTSWLTLEIGYQMFRNLVTASGAYGNPFWDRYQDMRVYLGVNVGLDRLAMTLRGTKGEPGVVRASPESRFFGSF
jgi:hypothetical protein